eukprot:4975485-Amphidinium_carterae.1
MFIGVADDCWPHAMHIRKGLSARCLSAVWPQVVIRSTPPRARDKEDYPPADHCSRSRSFYEVAQGRFWKLYKLQRTLAPHLARCIGGEIAGLRSFVDFAFVLGQWFVQRQSSAAEGPM